MHPHPPDPLVTITWGCELTVFAGVHTALPPTIQGVLGRYQRSPTPLRHQQLAELIIVLLNLNTVHHLCTSTYIATYCNIMQVNS